MAVAGVTGLIALVLGAKLCLEFGLPWRCPLIAVTGVPCPSCGSTRALAALAEFGLLAALRFNPLVVLGVLMIPFVGLSRHVPANWQKRGWSVFGAVVVLNWVYLMFFLPR